jgi:chromosome segregation ATPase
MTTDLTLYKIADEYREAADRLATLDLDEQTITDTLESLTGDLSTKASSITHLTRNLRAASDARKAASADLAAASKAIDARIEHIERYVLRCMADAGVTKIECDLFTITRRANPPAVEIFEPRLLTDEFMRFPPLPDPVPDKAAIKDALKAGRDVPGAKLTQSERLETK